MSSFRTLKCWQLARRLAFVCRRIAARFPEAEQDLADQLRRAANSIVLNIAEGTAKGTNKELRQFLERARASMHEVSAALTLAGDSDLVEEPTRSRVLALADETARTLYGYWRSVNKRIEAGENERIFRPLGTS